MKKIKLLVPSSQLLVASSLVQIVCTTLLLILGTGNVYAETLSIEHVEKLFLEGRYERAAYEAGELIDARSFRRDELYYIKGLSQLKLGRFAAARDSFSRVIDKYPASKRVFDARVGIGDSYFLEGKTDDAASAYNSIIASDSRDSNISVVYERLKDCPKKKELAPQREEAVITPPSQKKETTAESRTVESTKSSETVMARPHQPQTNFSPSSVSKYFSVQVGGFANKENAQKYALKLYREGHESFVETPAVSGDGIYRVKIGRYKEKKDAQALASKLKRDGYQTKICVGDRCE